MIDINNIKLPYVIKDKIMMSPGIWNNFYYSPEEIKNSFNKTNWKSKEVRSLFLDHVDDKSREWIGEIQNPRLIGDVLKADLVIVDLPTATKLAYGAKMGISPKVTGQTEDGENVMHQFLYDNFSVVINPAVKTAWINNMDMTAFEKIRKEKGLSPEEFYAIPMNPPSNSKLPIYDAAHVRNALARINQVKGISDENLAKAMSKIKDAAKKFNIKFNTENKEERNMNTEEEDSKANTAIMEEVDQDLMDYTDFVKQARKEHPDWSFEEIAAEYKKTQTNAEAEEKVNKLLGLAEQFITLAEELKIVKNEDKEEKPEDEKDDEEDKDEEMADKDKKDKEEEKPEDDKKDKKEMIDDKEKEEEKKPETEKKPEDKKDDKKKEDEDEEDKKVENAEVKALNTKNEELMQKINKMSKDYTQTMSQLNGQFNELKKKLDEPDKRSVKTVSMSNKISEPKIIEGTEDACFLNTLKDDLGGK